MTISFHLPYCIIYLGCDCKCDKEIEWTYFGPIVSPAEGQLFPLRRHGLIRLKTFMIASFGF